MTEKHVYLVDKDMLLSMQSDLATVKKSLQNLKVIQPSNDGYLTADEWMKQVKVSRWKFDMLIKSGLLKFIKRGRKFYIPSIEVTRYFEGELELPN